jgi:simple sugar transport system permease protein
MIGVVFLLLIFCFLTWQASGKSLNLGGMLSSAVSMAVPITLGAFSGILVNALVWSTLPSKVLMLMGSMVGALVGSVTQSVWLGLLVGILSAVLLAALHAVLSIKYKIDQIISGTVINISPPADLLSVTEFLQVHQDLNNPPMFTPRTHPGLSEIPCRASALQHEFLCVHHVPDGFLPAVGSVLHPLGIAPPRGGEHPKAADTLGIE